MTDNATAIARDLLARRAEELPRPAAEPYDGPASLAEAYAVQDAIEAELARLRMRAIGYKIGATNQMARDMLGVAEPFRGRLYDRMSSPSGAQVRRAGPFQVWEVEIALRMARDLDPAGAPFDAETVEAATAAVIPAIEIVGSVFHPFNQAPMLCLVADNAVHGHWVFGQEVNDWLAMDLMTAPVTLALDGEVRAEGAGRGVDGGAFESAAWLANNLAAEGRGLKAGEVITTGSVTPLIPIGRDREAVADFGALGEVRVSLV